MPLNFFISGISLGIASTCHPLPSLRDCGSAGSSCVRAKGNLFCERFCKAGRVLHLRYHLDSLLVRYCVDPVATGLSL